MSTSVIRAAYLEWLKDGKSLRLIIPDGSGGIWHFDELTAGKYRFSYVYENTDERVKSYVAFNKDFALAQEIEKLALYRPGSPLGGNPNKFVKSEK